MKRLAAHLAPLALALTVAACSGSVGDDDSAADDAAVSTPDASAPDATPRGPPDAGRPDATPPAPDADVDTCVNGTTSCADATTLVTCVDGQPVETDCDAIDQICKTTGNASSCQPAGTPTGNVVSGKIRYEDRVPQPSGALGGLTPLPARGVTVAVIADAGSAVLATGRTADDGSYSLQYTAAAGTMVHILASTTSDLPTRPMKVTKTNNTVHGFGSTSFAAAASTTLDVLVTAASNTSEAFNVFDQMIIGADAVRLRMGVATVQPLVAIWQKNSNDGTYYSGSLHLLGAASDDDGYDDAVILHEFGHWVEDKYGGTDSPGGSHDGSATDPRLAWSEGFSTYFSSAARANQFYMDSNSGGGFGDDLETGVTAANVNAAMTQNVSENMISQILWDVGDGQANDDDARAGGDRHEDVMKIQNTYLSTVSTTRGVAGVDLVDWLDGWFKKQGLTTCAALRTITTTTHKFPYDFAASGAACP